MSLQPTTIILSAELKHSITYDTTTSSLTANLPEPTPIEKVPNKQKLMLLIYFALRDKEQVSSPRKINGQISLELGIVERILLQFSNLAQAKRTLKEYTNVEDRTDTRMGTVRASEKGKNMAITAEVKDTLLGWFNDVLGSKNLPKATMQQETSAINTTESTQFKKRKRTTKATPNALLVENTGPPDDPISDPPSPPPATVKKRRQSKQSKDTSILTPGPPSSLPLHELARPSTADMSSDNIQRFMSSPVPANTIVPPSVPKKGSVAKDDGENEGESRESESESSGESGSDSSSKGSSSGSERGKHNDENSEGSNSGPKSSAHESSDGSSDGSSDDDSVSEDKNEQNGEVQDPEMDDFVKKVDDYAKLLYKNARLGQDAKVRKYTRKLKRLARKIRRD